MEKPLISIIIPNLNNQDRLELCLKALQRQTYPMDRVEIILADNGSSDRSVEIGNAYADVILLCPEYQSPYWCRNRGIAAAQGDTIVLLDSNCEPVTSWLEAGLQTLQQSDAGIVTGPVRFNFTPQKTFAERIDYLYSVYTAEDVRRATALPATHLFIRRTLFDHIGRFIPHIRSLGDIEWTRRAHTHGYAFAFANEAIVDYPAKPLAKAAKKMIRLGGGKKELWVHEGKSLLHAEWIWRIVKNLLPPSRAFYSDMTQRNRAENMQLSPFVLYLGLYAIKIGYAWGMLFKQVNRPIHKRRS